MPNRLAHETSPYLLQHADNPVDWRPWGEEAFAEARRRDVPIFLSVGYSSCHWCHVMAHESFEDDTIAAQLNDAFVNVKVDREERPDVDAVHMAATQAITGQGGWPMSVWLTPDGRPFHAGTYFPKEDRHGMPGFPRVIAAVREVWEHKRQEVATSASTLAEALARRVELAPVDELDPAATDEAARLVVGQAWDRAEGGFGRAPKFPQAMTISWLLHRHSRTGDPDELACATHALLAMARGGIHDQLAGGFARYSTDARWLVPHFEKMLYDNALLLPAYAEAAALQPDAEVAAELADVARRTATYLLTELRTDDGLFVAATDADSEGVEGRYFVWDHHELVEVLDRAGHDPARWTRFLGAVPGGNWEGVNVLHRPVPLPEAAREAGVAPGEFAAELDQVREVLLAHRARRVPPGVDDKALTDWNALAARGLLVAGRLLDEPDWLDAAVACLDALRAHHVVDGRLQHTSVRRDGPRLASVPAFCEDLATFALAELERGAALGDADAHDRAVALAAEVEARFADPDGGWFQTAADDVDAGPALPMRPKETWDNATPAGTSVMVEVCLRLAGTTGDLAWRDRAVTALRAVQSTVVRMPTGYGWTLRQLEALAAGPREVAIVGRPGPARDALAAVAQDRPRAGVLTVVADADHDGRPALLAHRGEVDGQPAAYVCRDLACERPVTAPEELRVQLQR